MITCRSSCCLYVKKRSDGSEDVHLSNGWVMFLPKKYAGRIQLDDMITEEVGVDFPENLIVNGTPIGKIRKFAVVKAA